MGSCVIFCAGRFYGLVEPIGQEDLVIAADGGLRHTQALGIKPRVMLGDFDSLGYIPKGGEVFPVEKDDTDAMLAVRRGLMDGFDRFVLYGALDGPRIDHTLANLQTLQFLADQGAQGYLVGRNYRITVVKNGALVFPENSQGVISVFCMGAPARGVSIEGLKYTMENGELTPGFPLGVSNSFTGAPARIAVSDGSLLVVYDRENAFPVREELP